MFRLMMLIGLAGYTNIEVKGYFAPLACSHAQELHHPVLRG